jgi:hypothetical protein
MLFADNGRRLASPSMRVFSNSPSDYYRINQQVNDFQLVLDRIKKNNLISINVDPLDFENRLITLKNKIQNNESFKNIINGVHIPFVYQGLNKNDDLGSDLEDYLLPAMQKSFKEKHPKSNFKATLQGNSVLINNLRIASNSRYEKFIEISNLNAVVGWYFPQALQEFDIVSQRAQMTELPHTDEFAVCLSGAKDICAAIVGSPDILISTDFYTPILCMSSYVHNDPRLVLLLKSYGPHLEFWCMSQMLTKNVTQVSEQWSGGLTIYESIK